MKSSNTAQVQSQKEVRETKRADLLDLGIEVYPASSFLVSHNSQDIHANFKEEKSSDFQNIKIAGRLMQIRIMGKAAFGELQDEKGRLQIYLNRDSICPTEDKTLYNKIFKKYIDLGDIVGLEGFIFKTKVGETTLHVQKFKLLSKALRPLPIVKVSKDEKGHEEIYDAFRDPEQRYRQRYVDLLVNPEVKKVFRQRTQLIQTIRDFLNQKEYIEVETPILQPLYGGALAKPFKTYYNSLDSEFYLRVANELYLKRLIVGGFDGVYEFAKDFRNEGMSRFHNPEFTQVELYVAYKDYEWMMNLVEELVEKVTLALHGTTKIQVAEHVIDFKRPWKRFTMYEAIEHFTGIDISQMDEKMLLNIAREKLKITLDNTMGRGKMIDEIFGSTCEPRLIQPTFITDYPIEMSPLAKKHRHKTGLVERFEAVCNGKEICNSFSELNDPIDQRKRFEKQLELRKKGDEEAMCLDEDFLRALEYGMPPTAGLGIGIDRLTMIMTNSKSIQDVLLFPHLRPKK